MAAAIESQQAVPLPPDGHDGSSPSTTTRIVPIPTPTIQTSAPSPGDPMEITMPTTAGGRSPPHSQNGTSINGGSNNNGNGNGNGSGTPEPGAKNTSPGASQPASHMSSMPAPPAAAAAAVHQPKIVQTAFIHKLYNMLEDPSIQHLISWSPTAESFVMSPSPDFSKVLAQYFKHTNISSFVRQLNMYGFHKVSDAFHTGNPDMALWEFKHGNGNFKRGDLVGLREIKRRASRHALVHRDYPNTKPSTSQPGTPAEPMPPPPPESAETRGGSVEHALNFQERSWVLFLTKDILFTETAVINLQSEMHRQADLLRSVDEPEPPFSASRSYFSNIENAPVSPRQMPQDDPRRTNLTVPSARGQGNFHRPPIPSNLSISTQRRYSSIGSNTAPQSPSPLRGAPPPPPQPHPLAQVAHSEIDPPPGSLARRHTSADIRAPGWQGNPPFPSSGPPSTHWPSSPSRVAPEDQRIRDSLSTYSLQSASQHHPSSRPATPPPPSNFHNGGGGGVGDGPYSFAVWHGTRRAALVCLLRQLASSPQRGIMAH
ncbi:flocculation suppression protein [Verticillium dahliae VdLs.17]|uniref:Flocculation suppression protein n=1 Tax=Verticillium dahliae (strain VdLs.17 / ATCC MYA-4575 / FGSC 10137) TaxID=498257 RepID=G2XBG0_VERDV|nr:flocculation suppression protein [Verticillium dahliae VdLs.17]EGY16328.1 flocculation suppression protein [Verticillium dahliae VdLs.17]